MQCPLYYRRFLTLGSCESSGVLRVTNHTTHLLLTSRLYLTPRNLHLVALWYLSDEPYESPFESYPTPHKLPPQHFHDIGSKAAGTVFIHPAPYWRVRTRLHLPPQAGGMRGCDFTLATECCERGTDSIPKSIPIKRSCLRHYS